MLGQASSLSLLSMYILHNMVQNLASGYEIHLSLLLYPYAPIPSPSGFGVGFWCLKTFSQGIGSTRDTHRHVLKRRILQISRHIIQPACLFVRLTPHVLCNGKLQSQFGD